MDDFVHDSPRAPRNLAAATLLLAATTLAGCLAAPPKGPEYDTITLAPPPADKAMLVVFRSYAEPTGLAASIFVDDLEVMKLPQESFGIALVSPGEHPFAMEWPRASATPGWDGKTAQWEAGRTYFYELTGTAGRGFYFRSQVAEIDPRLADIKMRECCKLNTDQMGNAAVLGTPPPAPAAPAARDISFGGIKAGMLQKEVIDLIGVPDSVASKTTAKGKNPLGFSPDTLREYWGYAGVGYVVFTHNNYNNTSRVVETTADATAK